VVLESDWAALGLDWVVQGLEQFRFRPEALPLNLLRCIRQEEGEPKAAIK